jgi:hypothetical protein
MFIIGLNKWFKIGIGIEGESNRIKREYFTRANENNIRIRIEFKRKPKSIFAI